MKNGTLQRTSLDTGLHPWRNQYFLGLYNWYQNASLFQAIPVNEAGLLPPCDILGQRRPGLAVRPAAGVVADLTGPGALG
jgi:hypothetical protein